VSKHPVLLPRGDREVKVSDDLAPTFPYAVAIAIRDRIAEATYEKTIFLLMVICGMLEKQRICIKSIIQNLKKISLIQKRPTIRLMIAISFWQIFRFQ